MLRWFCLLLVFSLGACSSLQVSWDYDVNADFSTLRSYDWLPIPAAESAAPRLQYDSLLETRVKQAVDSELARKGFRRDTEKPDYLVGYNVAIDEKVAVTYLNELYGYGPGWGERRHIYHYGYPSRDYIVDEYQQGTLILDIVSTDTGQLIWRGTASDEVYPDLGQEAREKRVREAVKKILEQFPPARQ